MKGHHGGGQKVLGDTKWMLRVAPLIKDSDGDSASNLNSAAGFLLINSLLETPVPGCLRALACQ